MQESRETTIFVVGNRFHAFSDQTSSVTVSQLVDLLRAGGYQDLEIGETLVLVEGQGVAEYDWGRVENELERSGLTRRTVVHRSSRGPAGTHEETHKLRESNVLIAGLTRRSDNTFRASLRLHNDHEMQLDHQASHVQGMVVVEAARQMYLAVCEDYYTCMWRECRYSHVFSTLETTFRNFLFPLEVAIDCEVMEADLGDPENLSFDIEVRFGQAGIHAATVRM